MKKEKKEVVEQKGWMKIVGWISVIIAIFGFVLSLLMVYSCLGCSLPPILVVLITSLLLLIVGLFIIAIYNN